MSLAHLRRLFLAQLLLSLSALFGNLPLPLLDLSSAYLLFGMLLVLLDLVFAQLVTVAIQWNIGFATRLVTEMQLLFEGADGASMNGMVGVYRVVGLDGGGAATEGENAAVTRRAARLA